MRRSVSWQFEPKTPGEQRAILAFIRRDGFDDLAEICSGFLPLAAFKKRNMNEDI